MSGDVPPLSFEQVVALRQKLEQLLEGQSYILLLRCDEHTVNLVTNITATEVISVIRSMAERWQP